MNESIRLLPPVESSYKCRHLISDDDSLLVEQKALNAYFTLNINTKNTNLIFIYKRNKEVSQTPEMVSFRLLEWSILAPGFIHKT